jgi:hypothetical protein
MTACSPGVGRRDAKPIAAIRIGPCPTRGATFTETPGVLSRSRYSPKLVQSIATPHSDRRPMTFGVSAPARRTGAQPWPQFPVTTVVTPWPTALSAVRQARRLKSPC